MKRKLLVVLIVLLVAFSMLLAACQPAAPAEEPAAEQPVADEPAEEEITIRWRTRPGNQTEIDVYQKVSDDIDAELDGITLVYEPGASSSSSYQDVLKTEVGAGTAPDVFWIPGTDIADFVSRGLIMDISDMADSTDGFSAQDFYEGPMYHLTYNPETGANDALWGLPRDVSTFAMFINMDLINEAGAADPRELAREGNWDFDAFAEVSSQVNELGSDIYGYGQNTWWAHYGYWMDAAGGGFFNEDRTACAFDTDESIAGLVFLKDMYDSGSFVPYGEDTESAWLAGKVGMYMNGRWFTPGAREGASFNWDVVEPPAGAAGMKNWLFWGAYVVNAKTEHPEEAWKLIQALTTAESQAKIAELGANIPSRVSQEALDAFLTFTPPDNNQAFLNGLAQDPVAEGPLWEGNWPEFDSIVGAKVAAFLNGEITVDEFRNSVCAEADKAFNQ